MKFQAHHTFSRFCFVAAIGCLFVQPAYAFAMQPNDPQWSDAHDIASLQLPLAWDKTQGSSDVIVAVIDTGVDMTNPELQQNIWANPNERMDGKDDDGDGYIDDLNGWNFVDNNGDVRPSNLSASSTHVGVNHGTVVAGIIGAQGDNYLGGAGVAWHVKIMPLKILDEQGNGDSDLAVKAIDYAIAHKANIINLSFVGPTPSLNFIQAIRRAYRAGITVVAAAGNAPEHAAGTNLDVDPQYPVCFDDPLNEENWVIGVAALDDNGLLAPFSNYGSKCVDVSAPGYRIASTLFFDPQHNAPDIFGGTWSGTSIAAPFVSGVAALVKSVQPEWGPDQIRNAIVETADPIPGNEGLVAGRGSVNAYKAVEYALHGGAATTGSIVAGVVYSKKGASLVTYDDSLQASRSILFATGKVTGAEVVAADVDGSGATPFIVGYNDNKGPIIKILQQDGKQIKEIRPFPKNVHGAIHFTTADVDRNGSSEIIVAADHYSRVKILNANGTERSSFSLLDANGAVNVAAVYQHGATRIATAVTHQNKMDVYVTDENGSFVSYFTLPLDTGAQYHFGSVDQGSNGGQLLYLAKMTDHDVSVQYLDTFGVAKTDFLPSTLDGKIVGISFAQLGDQLRLTATTLSGSALKLTVFDQLGLVSYTLDRGTVKGEKYDPFIFAP